jgi:hypothetical protein
MASASATVTGRPGSEGIPTTAPSSSSMSKRREGAKTGASSPAGLICPQGRRTGVPDATTDEARPL